VDSQGNLPSLGLLFVDPVSPSDPSFNGTYSNTLVLKLDKHWVQVNPSNGNWNMDLCFAAQRVSKATGQPIPCNATQPPDSTGQGWISHAGTAAGCASDGNYWARIGDKQDHIPVFDPQIVDVASDMQGNRIVTISLGDSTGLSWFWDLKWSP
jgi:hypothetical protein